MTGVSVAEQQIFAYYHNSASILFLPSSFSVFAILPAKMVFPSIFCVLKTIIVLTSLSDGFDQNTVVYFE
jgi:hypothetical protein